jgi:hypothetical protein
VIEASGCDIIEVLEDGDPGMLTHFASYTFLAKRRDS